MAAWPLTQWAERTRRTNDPRTNERDQVGGVVDEATIDDEQSTLANEFVRDCIRESMMAVSFDAPADGGRVDVTFPLEFRPDEE